MRAGTSSAGVEPSCVEEAQLWQIAPRTSRQTVRGVERISPTGPQSAVHNIAAAISDMADRPVLNP